MVISIEKQLKFGHNKTGYLLPLTSVNGRRRSTQEANTAVFAGFSAEIATVFWLRNTQSTAVKESKSIMATICWNCAFHSKIPQPCFTALVLVSTEKMPRKTCTKTSASGINLILLNKLLPVTCTAFMVQTIMSMVSK